MLDSKKIRSVMRGLLNDCRDNQTGEMNHTLLAELTCHEMEAYEGNDIPEVFFELAVDFE